MSKFTRRGSLAATAAIAAVLASATTASATPDATPLVPAGDKDAVTRISGDDRILTAIEASKAQYTDEEVAKGIRAVIVTRSDDFADALASAPLADALEAPILTTATGKDLDARVEAEITRLKPNAVIVVGGENAVSKEAAETLDSIEGVASFERISGVDRYETAVKLADETIERLPAGPATSPVKTRANTPVFLTTGLDFADALAAGAAAAEFQGVVLLTKGEAFDSSTPEGATAPVSYTRGYVEGEAKPQSVYAVGGPAAKAAGLGATEVFDGADRYETATKVAERFFPNKPQQIAVASGASYADAVVAAGFVANQDGPLLLTKPGSLPKYTADYLGKVSAKETATNAYLFGGTTAVSAEVKTAIEGAIK